MLKTIGGDCDTAVGGLAILKDKKIKLKGQLFSDDGRKNFNCEIYGEKDEVKEIGLRAGNELIRLAGNHFKKINKKMNILITRPLIDSEDLMKQFFSMGHKIIHLPTLKISSSNMEPIDLNNYDALVFTSVNAVRNLKLLNQNKSKPCFCVGAITEKIARQSGFTNTFSAGGTVNALKNLILSSNEVNEKSKIVYFCGDNISFDLDTDLQRRFYN